MLDRRHAEGRLDRGMSCEHTLKGCLPSEKHLFELSGRIVQVGTIGTRRAVI